MPPATYMCMHIFLRPDIDIYCRSRRLFIYDYCRTASRVRCIRVMNRCRLNIDGLLYSHLRGKPARIIYNLYDAPLRYSFRVYYFSTHEHSGLIARD